MSTQQAGAAVFGDNVDPLLSEKIVRHSRDSANSAATNSPGSERAAFHRNARHGSGSRLLMLAAVVGALIVLLTLRLITHRK
jgi:hypothetical protein